MTPSRTDWLMSSLFDWSWRRNACSSMWSCRVLSSSLSCRGPEGQANTRSQEWLKRDVISEPQLCAKADALSAARVVVRRLMVGGAGRTAPMRRIANCRSGHCDGRQRVVGRR